jgi:hypothetical protein
VVPRSPRREAAGVTLPYLASQEKEAEEKAAGVKAAPPLLVTYSLRE